MPCKRQVTMRLCMIPTCLVPSSVQQKSQLLRLCKALHKRRYVQFVIMRTFASDLQIPEDRLAKQCRLAFIIYCRPSDTTAHNHKLSKNASNDLGGLNRVAVISGG